MTIDSYEIPNGRVIDTDLCIVGGGMVGIAMARELKASGLGVVVLESGGMEFEGPS
ncbi:MAG: FAD-dependent oxidoreductase [Candidatus Hydrogenedentota bacterium]